MTVASLPITKLGPDAEFTKEILAANFRVLSQHTQDVEDWMTMAEEIFAETANALEALSKKVLEKPKGGNKKVVVALAVGVYLGVKLSDRRNREKIQARLRQAYLDAQAAAERAQQAAAEKVEDAAVKTQQAAQEQQKN